MKNLSDYQLSPDTVHSVEHCFEELKVCKINYKLKFKETELIDQLNLLSIRGRRMGHYIILDLDVSFGSKTSLNEATHVCSKLRKSIQDHSQDLKEGKLL